MSTITKLIGHRIRFYRLQAGLTQEALAEKADVHPTYIGQVERGEKNVTLVSLEKILSALHISWSEAFAHVSPSAPSDSVPDMCYELICQMTPERQRHVLRILQEIDEIIQGQ